MTYNVHRCVGRGGYDSIDDIAVVCAETRPDLIALQELDAPETDDAEGQAHHLLMDVDLRGVGLLPAIEQVGGRAAHRVCERSEASMMEGRLHRLALLALLARPPRVPLDRRQPGLERDPLAATVARVGLERR